MQSEQDRFHREQPESSWTYQSIFGERRASDFTVAAHGFIKVTFNEGYNGLYKEIPKDLFVAIDKIIYVRANTAARNQAVIGCVLVEHKRVDCELDGKRPSNPDYDYVFALDYSRHILQHSLVAYHVRESVETVMDLINAERELIRMIHG